MRRLRESFEHLTGISNMNNDLINRGKAPKGFQLLDAKDTTREESTIVKHNTGFMSMFKKNKHVAKLHHMDDDFKHKIKLNFSRDSREDDVVHYSQH